MDQYTQAILFGDTKHMTESRFAPTVGTDTDNSTVAVTVRSTDNKTTQPRDWGGTTRRQSQGVDWLIDWVSFHSLHQLTAPWKAK